MSYNRCDFRRSVDIEAEDTLHSAISCNVASSTHLESGDVLYTVDLLLVTVDCNLLVCRSSKRQSVDRRQLGVVGGYHLVIFIDA